MSVSLPRIFAGVISGSVRAVESLLPITRDAERYLNEEISFEKATDDVVKRIYIYTSLTTIKFGCDAIFLCMTGKWIYDVVIAISSIFKQLINCGLEAFINGIQLSAKHFFSSLRSCSIALILREFKYLYDKQQKFVSSISLITLCNICDQIYFLIIGKTCGFKKTIQIELMKYYLECTGIIRAIAEANNIDFIKYMEKSRSKDFVNDKRFSDINEIQWESTKDSDIRRTIKLSLEDIFHGKTCEESIRREIRIIGKQGVEIEEEKYQVIIEPGCPDGKEFRFIEVGNRDPVNCPADLVVQIETEQHPLYERNGSNLIYTANISLNDALEGTPIEVPLIDGTMAECDPHGVINTKTKVIIKNAGLPDPSNGGIRGDLIVKYDIEFPTEKIGVEPTE